MPPANTPATTAMVDTAGHALTANAALDASRASVSPELGTYVGPWLLGRLLGRGGMGAVYLAERNEHEFQQRAALKLIKLGMDSGEILQRFLAERRILARLEHPNIARLIDGGVDLLGRPYFVMEWVDGLPLLDYANAQSLDAAGRLRLFLKLCDAVAHAHRQLVVHRDLKPGNILVDTRGEPKLLDFGIAKVLHSEHEDTSATGPRYFTRAYASPEQMRGEPVSTATDIYALGAVLFELLTGAARHRARTTLHETRELLAQARRRAGIDGPAAVTPRMLAGDLALVVAKSLRDEPARRYVSVEAFADDLRAFLDGRPVRARAGSLSYRMQRYARRHWLGVLASSAVVVALVGGAALALWQARIAQQESLRAEAVSAFLSSVFESATPEGAAGGDITAKSLLERGEQRIERELAGQPAVRARLYATLGKAWFYIGDQARAARMYEAGRALVAADDWRTQTALLRGLAQAELASGQVQLARTHIDQALALLPADDTETRLEHLRTQSVQKSLLGAEGATLAALNLARDVYAGLQAQLGPQAEESLQALNDLGTWTLESGDAQAALPILDAVIDARRRVSGSTHPEIAAAMHNRALALFRLGQTEQALAQARAVVALRRQILPSEHRDLARSLGAQAMIESSLGATQDAYALRTEALHLLREQARPDQLLLGQELTNQGTDAFRLGDLDSAVRDLNEAVQRLQPQLAVDDPRLLAANTYLGLVDSFRGNLSAAQTRLRSVDLQEQARSDVNATQRLTTLRYLARVLRWQGRPAEAIDALRDAQALLADQSQTLPASIRLRLAVELALAYIDDSKLELAQLQIGLAIAGYPESAQPSELDQAQLLLAQARLALAFADFGSARERAAAALQRYQRQLNEGHWDIGEARSVLSMANWGLAKDRKTRAGLLSALDWQQAQRPWHPDTARLQALVKQR